MRVLWFSNTPAGFRSGTSSYNGGGWIESLKEFVASHVELAIAFTDKDGSATKSAGSGDGKSLPSELQGIVRYYPVYNPFDSSRLARVKSLLFGDKKQHGTMVEAYKKVIDDYKPDVIEIFGTEHDFGLVTPYAESRGISVCIHLQGIIEPYLKAYIPDNKILKKEHRKPCRRNWIWNDGFTGASVHRLYMYRKMVRARKIEARIFGCNHNFLGRTDWDRQWTGLLNPKGRYFHCGEILRPEFYVAAAGERINESLEKIGNAGETEEPKEPRHVRIVTVISSVPYKGMDLVLQAGQLLRKRYAIHLDWDVYGNVDPEYAEKLTGIKTEDAGVNVKGVASAQELADVLSGKVGDSVRKPADVLSGQRCVSAQKPADELLSGKLVDSARNSAEETSGNDNATISESVVYVHPSYIDNSPNSLCEAQLLGCPVVACNVGGIGSLIVDGTTGLLVEKGDAEDLADKIAWMVNHPEEAQKIGLNAAAAASVRHGRTAIASELIGIYNTLVHRD